jgi:diguanylate cyclase (GGDEF)-like protein/PAS domain S-box-containing protein
MRRAFDSVRALKRRGAAALPLPEIVAGFVILVCCALVGLDAINLWYLNEKDMVAAGQETANLARSLAQHAEDIFRTADSSIIGSVHRLEMDGTSNEGLRQLNTIMAARLAMFPALADWVILDENGACIASGRPITPADCRALKGDNLPYHRTHSDPGAYVGAPLRSASGTWFVPLSHRFNDKDGRFAGMVVAGISLDFFQKFYETFNIGDHGAILLATNNGTLLARRPFFEQNIGRDLHNSTFFREYLSRNNFGTVVVTSSTDNIARLNSYHRVDDYPLVVSVAFATSDILASWRAQMRFRLWRTGGLIIIIGALGMWMTRQLRQQRRLEDAFHKTSAALRVLAENSADLIVQVGPDMKRSYVSPASRSLLGYEPEEMLGMRTDDILHPDDRALWEEAFGERSLDCSDDIQATYRVLRADGSPIWVEVNRRSLGPDQGFVVATRDVTRRKEIEAELADANQRLELIANEDGLTHLANRRRFDETLANEFRRAKRDGTGLSLIMIDVDHFKLFNDYYGHPAGDRCLADIAFALSKVPGRGGDLVARYGGEEFCIVLPTAAGAGAVVMAERARATVRALKIPHEHNEAKIVTISLGVAWLTADSAIATPEELIYAADTALYRAKNGGRDQVGRPEDPAPQPRASDTKIKIGV